jgi:hypothetical protein
MEHLTKIDAARRQVDEAIKMLFDKRDTIATHTVVCAASQALADLGNVRGVPGWTRNKNIIKPEHWKKFRKAITEAETFFKHADQDPDGTLGFHPEITPLFLAEAVEMLRLLAGKLTWPAMVFAIWFSHKYPDLLLEGELKQMVTAQAALNMLDVNDFVLQADLIRHGYSLLPNEFKDMVTPPSS